MERNALPEAKMKCKHTDQIKITKTEKHVCEDCVKTGDTWVHLRLCLSCGHVGCCDSSNNRHATKHFKSSKHALMRSIEPGEAWMWSYVDEISPGELDAAYARNRAVAEDDAALSKVAQSKKVAHTQ